jgi:hypothetical protein
MPCRVDLCENCGEYDCGGFSGGTFKYLISPQRISPPPVAPTKSSAPPASFTPPPPATPTFDIEGALCDVLSLLEDRYSKALSEVDPKTLEWWKIHEKLEENTLKKKALAKLTPRERRLLGLK